MVYREAASRVWRPVTGNWKRRLVCPFVGHCDHVILRETFPVDPPHYPDPEPPNGSYITQRLNLYWIQAIECRVHRCERCGSEWMEQLPQTADEPITITHYLMFRGAQ